LQRNAVLVSVLVFKNCKNGIFECLSQNAVQFHQSSSLQQQKISEQSQKTAVFGFLLRNTSQRTLFFLPDVAAKLPFWS